MHLTTKLYTLFKGRPVGVDNFGNRYFESRVADKSGKRKRWVIYNGRSEASKVPPEWHGWLHYTFSSPIQTPKHTWQKSFLPNLTGTKFAYLPPGHLKKGAKREKATGDYEAWHP